MHNIIPLFMTGLMFYAIFITVQLRIFIYFSIFSFKNVKLDDNLIIRSGNNNYKLGRADIVSKVIVHPNYNNGSYINDAALLQMKSSIAFTDSIKKIRLAEQGQDPAPYSPAVVTGWGDTVVRT